MKIDQNLIIQIISLITILGITLFKDPKTATPQDVTIFIGIILSISLLIFFVWVINKFNQIDKNKKDIKIIGDKLNLRKDNEKMLEKISRIEGWKESIENLNLLSKNRKGQLDPRIIMVIIIIILIYLYLKPK